VKIILTQDVENLGSLGDTVDVKPGYGRNFLIPQGVALLATGKASKELRHRLKHLEKLREGEIALALEQAEKLKALKLEVIRKAGPGGRLFGSVTNKDLNLLLKENNFELNRRAIQLHSPIRETGMHQFSVRIHSEITVTMQVQVNGEKGDLSIKKESEGLKTEQNDSEKENANFHADQNNSEQEPETLQTEQNDVEKDLEKKETVISQKNTEG
jgi:large subunit ribosomal protein L9